MVQSVASYLVNATPQSQTNDIPHQLTQCDQQLAQQEVVLAQQVDAVLWFIAVLQKRRRPLERDGREPGVVKGGMGTMRLLRFTQFVCGASKQ